MRIVVDGNLNAGPGAHWLTEFLLEFRHRDLVEIFVQGPEARPGFFHIGPVDVAHDLRPVRVENEGGGWADAAMFPYQQWVSIATGEATRLNEAVQPWINDLVLAQGAIAVQSDLLVTDSARLHSSDRDFIRQANPVSVAEAVATVGLFLRAHSDFVVWPGEHGEITYNRGLFFWVGMRGLLPSSWRWFSACVQSSAGNADEAVVMIGQSALERVNRCLKARDSIHAQMVREQNNDTADDAMYHVDALLLFLYGAFDAAARIAHLSLGFSRSGLRDAGWRRPPWLKRAIESAPELELVIGNGTDGRAVLDVIGQMRNSIHGEALSSVGYKDSSGPLETRIRLPHAEFGALLQTTDRLGGQGLWGIGDLMPGAAGLDPQMFVETLLPRAIRLLDEIFALTPVERLPAVAIDDLMSGPPNESAFGDERMKRIAALIGLS